MSIIAIPLLPNTYNGTVGESLRKGRGDEDDVGEDDGPLSTKLFGQGQLHTGTEEGTALKEGDQVCLCCRASFAHLEVALERVESQRSTEKSSVVTV